MKLSSCVGSPRDMMPATDPSLEGGGTPLATRRSEPDWMIGASDVMAEGVPCASAVIPKPETTAPTV